MKKKVYLFFFIITFFLIQNKPVLSQTENSVIISVGDYPITRLDLLKEIKNIFKCSSIKYTQVVNKKVEKIAICGGSGSFLTKDAIRSGADVFITSDLKYHDFFEANNKITLIDIGHYESEQFTKDLIFEFLNKNLVNIALHLSNENTNPIKYF